MPGSKNVKAHPLVTQTNVLLLPLHINLGCIKYFLKGMDKDEEGFKYLQGKFLAFSEAKLQAGIFAGPQIREPLKDGDFEKSLSLRNFRDGKV